MKETKCKDCRFGRDLDDIKESLLCVKYAPRSQFQDEATDEVRWPRVFTYDWCGEFSRKTEGPTA